MSWAFPDDDAFCPESFSLLIFKCRYVLNVFPYHFYLAYQGVPSQELFMLEKSYTFFIRHVKHFSLNRKVASLPSLNGN